MALIWIGAKRNYEPQLQEANRCNYSNSEVVSARRLFREREEADEEQQCAHHAGNVQPAGNFRYRIEVCDLHKPLPNYIPYLFRSSPSEYTQSVMGHGRQQLMVPSIEGTGAQKRPSITAKESIRIHPSSYDGVSLTASIAAEVVKL